ncbi:MAG: hypothetical protein AAF587_10525 [Bacteroidota bacterium]
MMKKLLFFVSCLLTIQLLQAQAPQGINYQAVLRDGNTVVANASINLLLAFEDANAGIIYEESHNLTTNEFGLFTAVLGEGTPIIGTFGNVDWSMGGIQFEAEVTYNGTIYSLGRVKLQSVAYSLFTDHAAKADTAAYAAMTGAGDMGLNDLNDVSVDTTGLDEGAPLVWDGTEWVPAIGTAILDDLILTTTVLGPDWIADTDSAAGIMATAGNNGNLNFIAAYGSDGNLGFAGVADTAGDVKAFMDVPTAISGGEGRIITLDPDGDLNMIIGGVGTNPQLGAISVYDADGNGTGILGAGTTSQNSAGFLELNSGTGGRNLSTFGPSSEQGQLALYDSLSMAKTILRVNSNRSGRIDVMGPSGGDNVEVGSFGNGPDVGIVVASDNSTPGSNARAGIFGSLGGSGAVETTGPNGFANFAAQSAPFAGVSANNGSAFVYDSTGSFQAGMYVNAIGDGVIFGDIKNFRIPHPKQADKEIWYASLEGPEAAAYVRGTAQLVNGEGEVTFPEHFAAIANPQTMTVVLTPLSANSEGMAVIEKTANGFKVKELRQGSGTYGFDWEVKAVRTGYENYRPVRNASEYQPKISPEERRRAIMESNTPISTPSVKATDLLPNQEIKKQKRSLKEMK